MKPLKNPDILDQLMEEWRAFLYPFGFLSALVFGIRCVAQWLQSEKTEKSVVNRSFWQLSLLGNFLLMLHSVIQIQFHVCVVQACHAVISWRNLNLMQRMHSPYSFRVVVLLFVASIISVVLAFILQERLLIDKSWFHIPTTSWQILSFSSVSMGWHIMGSIGYLLFSSRFWIQWWIAERAYTSQLTPSFWWFSLIGALISSAYFIRIGDSVNLVGSALGIIPYIRNLLFIKNSQSLSKT